MWSGATGPVSVTDAQGGTTPLPPRVTLVLHLYSWAGAHLPGICFSFRNSEMKGFCFAQSSDLWFPGLPAAPLCAGRAWGSCCPCCLCWHGQGMARVWDHPKTLS